MFFNINHARSFHPLWGRDELQKKLDDRNSRYINIITNDSDNQRIEITHLTGGRTGTVQTT